MYAKDGRKTARIDNRDKEALQTVVGAITRAGKGTARISSRESQSFVVGRRAGAATTTAHSNNDV